MTTLKISGEQPKNFKQVEESWLSTYLPAICGVVLMTGIVVLAMSCSKKSNNVAKISPPTQPAVTSPAPSTPTAIAETPKKKVVKKHRAANATYVDSTYGVSFSFPRKYSLQSGDKLGSSTLPTFLKPGATQVAAVDMPDDSYPDTDFSSALLNVSVSKDMTSDECAQFVPPSKEAGEVKPTIAKLGANEYSVFEQISGIGDRKSDLKYFHLFKNNACYEFALDVDTLDKAEEMAQVDRGKVIKQLERIVTTARIKDLQPTEVETAKAPAGDVNTSEVKATETKTNVDTTEKAQVVTPEQK